MEGGGLLRAEKIMQRDSANLLVVFVGIICAEE
jgi:hypothetical protein